MHQRIQYPESIEPLVQFIEQTPPAEILDRTLEKLRAGISTQTMLTASALAVVRSSDLPPGHHGGPLHPLAGLHAITHLSNHFEGVRMPSRPTATPTLPAKAISVMSWNEARLTVCQGPLSARLNIRPPVPPSQTFLFAGSIVTA